MFAYYVKIQQLLLLLLLFFYQINAALVNIRDYEKYVKKNLTNRV